MKRKYDFHFKPDHGREMPNGEMEYTQELDPDPEVPVNIDLMRTVSDENLDRFAEREKLWNEKKEQKEWNKIQLRRILLMPVLQLTFSVLLKLFLMSGILGGIKFFIVALLITLFMYYLAHHEERFFRHAQYDFGRDGNQCVKLFCVLQVLPTLLLILLLNESAASWPCALPVWGCLYLELSGKIYLLANAVAYFVPIVLITVFEFRVTKWLHSLGM